MSWVAIALAGAAVAGVVHIVDKTALHRYATTPLTVPLLIAFAQTATGIVVLIGTGIPAGATPSASAVAFGSGLLYGISGAILMWVLFSREVSRTIPVWQTAPIFAAIFAFAFLGETISVVRGIAVMATVMGAVAISVRIDGQYRRGLIDRSFFLLFFGAAVLGAANVVGKAAVDELPVLYTHGLRALAIGFVFLALSLRREALRTVVGFVKQRSPVLLFVGINELVVANAALLLILWALSLGPVTLVVALAGTRSLFVVVYSTLLAVRWRGALGEVTTPRVVAVKVAATVLIVAGVTGIAF